MNTVFLNRNVFFYNFNTITSDHIQWTKTYNRKRVSYISAAEIQHTARYDWFHTVQYNGCMKYWIFTKQRTTMHATDSENEKNNSLP